MVALINCEECGASVSDKAHHCIKCGAPVAIAKESIAAGAELSTVQETSKKLKLNTLFASILFWGGIISVFNTASPLEVGSDPPILATLSIMVGAIWYIVTKFRVWWHHK